MVYVKQHSAWHVICDQQVVAFPCSSQQLTRGWTHPGYEYPRPLTSRNPPTLPKKLIWFQYKLDLQTHSGLFMLPLRGSLSHLQADGRPWASLCGPSQCPGESAAVSHLGSGWSRAFCSTQDFQSLLPATLRARGLLRGCLGPSQASLYSAPWDLHMLQHVGEHAETAHLT